MSKTRPPYSAEFREQIIELARGGRTPTELSSEFGVSSQAIRNWLRPHGLVASPPGRSPAPKVAGSAVSGTSTTTPLTAAEREELARLRRELARVKMERDILAKATAWFAAKGEKMSNPSSS